MTDNKMQELNLDEIEDTEVADETEEKVEAPFEDEDGTVEVVKETIEAEEDKEEEVEVKKESRAQKRIRDLVAQRKDAEARAEAAYNEKRQMEEELKTFRKVTIDSQKTLIKDSVAHAKRQLKIALDSDDHDAVIEAQSLLNTAQGRLSAIESIPDEVDEPARPQHRQAQASDAPEAMQNWLSKNSWFQQPKNEREGTRIQAAVGMYNMLVSEGEDPESDEFYDLIDERLGTKERKIDKPSKNSVESTSDNDISSDAQTVTREKKKISQTVQGVSRTPNQTSQKNKIVLDANQKNIARSMGISDLEYARQLQKIESASKRGDKMVELF